MKARVKNCELINPVGVCCYCMDRNKMLSVLPCQHAFCAPCSKVLVQVTKIKNTNALTETPKDDEEALKCPKCMVVHLVGEEHRKNW